MCVVCCVVLLCVSLCVVLVLVLVLVLVCNVWCVVSVVCARCGVSVVCGARLGTPVQFVGSCYERTVRHITFKRLKVGRRVC